ncbi:MAG: S8 family serine peptidase, partial [Micromonosporaceae bacterium]
MRTLYAAGTLLVALGTTMAVTTAVASANETVSDYIVVLDDTADPAAAARAARAGGAEVGHVYSHAVRGYSAQLSASAATRLAHAEGVRFVQPDGVATTTAQSLPTGIDRADAELSPTAMINGADERVDVDVAIIDTGIDLDHPDLNVHAAGAKNCSTGRTADDGNGHGSHVAGTVGALDNADGVVGVAPGARVWP